MRVRPVGINFALFLPFHTQSGGGPVEAASASRPDRLGRYVSRWDDHSAYSSQQRRPRSRPSHRQASRKRAAGSVRESIYGALTRPPPTSTAPPPPRRRRSRQGQVSGGPDDSKARSSPHPSALLRSCLRLSERVPARTVPSKPPPTAPGGGAGAALTGAVRTALKGRTSPDLSAAHVTRPAGSDVTSERAGPAGRLDGPVQVVNPRPTSDVFSTSQCRRRLAHS